MVKRSTQDDKKVDSFTNGDDFNAQIYTLQITNKTPWTLGATEWNTTLGADWLNTGRADLEKTLDPDEAVILDGRLMSRAQMEKEVNNNEEEWMVRLGVDMKIPDNNITGRINFILKHRSILMQKPTVRMILLFIKRRTSEHILNGIPA